MIVTQQKGTVLENHVFSSLSAVPPLRTPDKLPASNNNLGSGRGHKTCRRAKTASSRKIPATLFQSRVHTQPPHTAKKSFADHPVNLSYTLPLCLHHHRVRQLVRMQYGPATRGPADHFDPVRLGAIHKNILRRLIPPQGKGPGIPAIDSNRRKSPAPEQGKRKALVGLHVQPPGALATVEKPPGHGFNPAGLLPE